jgi:hypothetical protein
MIEQSVEQTLLSTFDPAAFKRAVATFEGSRVRILASGPGFGMRLEGPVVGGDVSDGVTTLGGFFLALRKYGGVISVSVECMMESQVAVDKRLKSPPPQGGHRGLESRLPRQS